MVAFLEKGRTIEDCWRAVILFGVNVASYKFALGKSLLDLSSAGESLVTLKDLAVPFSKHIVEHLKRAPKQATSSSSRFLDACRSYELGEIKKDELIERTVRLGFNNVIDAFHIVNRAEIPVRFFRDERNGERGGIRLTDELFRLREQIQYANLPHEVEARWRLVETAWQLRLPASLVVSLDDHCESIVSRQHGRRAPVTKSRDALNGYQKGRCFYCFAHVSIDTIGSAAADVDHFFPRVLLRLGMSLPLDGVWNLVLSCRNCNRGIDGKSTRLPHRRMLSRIHTRNEFLIGSNHPLRDTLIAQTGNTTLERVRFLTAAYEDAFERLIHNWEPSHEHEAAF
jgi:5-methylcytosine-specific restriction endonuclease McrA